MILWRISDQYPPYHLSGLELSLATDLLRQKTRKSTT